MDQMSISSSAAPDGCDTLQPPTRRYFRRSATPIGRDGVQDDNPETTINATASDSENEPGLTLDVFGLHDSGSPSLPPNRKDVDRPVSRTRTAKGKAKENHVEDWLQPPGRKLCSRHQRMADEGTNLQLQKVSTTYATSSDFILNEMNCVDSRGPSLFGKGIRQSYLVFLQLVLAQSQGSHPTRHLDNVLPKRA